MGGRLERKLRIRSEQLPGFLKTVINFLGVEGNFVKVEEGEKNSSSKI